ISEGGAKEIWPMWSKDGRTVYYISDRSGAQNVWARDLSGKSRQVTQFKDVACSGPVSVTTGAQWFSNAIFEFGNSTQLAVERTPSTLRGEARRLVRRPNICA